MLLTEPLISCPCCVFGVIVMLEDPAMTHLQCSYWGEQVVGQNLTIHGPIYPPVTTVQSSCPLCRKAPQSMMFPPPCFMVGMMILGLYYPSSSKHGEWSFSGSSRWFLANFRRAWTRAGLSRGTLLALQDFNSPRCSVLLMVTIETVVPALFRSLTRSSRVVLGWSLTFLRIIDTPRGEILHGAPVRGRLTVILNFFHFLIIAPTVVAFSPSCLPIVL